MSMHFTRREMLAASAGILSMPWQHLLANEKKVSVNERLHVGVIGVDGQGKYNWTQLEATGEVEIVALCDVHESRKGVGEVREKFTKAKFYTDFRKMIDAKGLDAVLVATPDHTHAVATYYALKNGLHTYCEKPLTHNVKEARLLAETAKKEKRVTQMGTQIHAGANYRRVVEIIQSGLLGPISEVHVWCDKSWGGTEGRPQDKPDVPQGLNWDLWLGPAPERPYHSAYVPANWRRWWDFGGGTLADMACHFTDLPFWALNLRHPTRIKAKGPELSSEMAAMWTIVEYEYPARGDQPALKLTWYDGGKRPKDVIEGKYGKLADGVLFIGSKGQMYANYGSYKLFPQKEFADFKAPPKTIADSIGHHKEWVRACKGEGTTLCNFDYSGALTEAVLLGIVSLRSGKELDWDAVNLKIKNAPEAEKWLTRNYRKGWELPS